jgi:flagellar hook-associated protein 3 FlgL
MLSSLNPTYSEFLNNLNRISETMQQAQLQITSGSKMSQISDAPDSISPLLTARAQLSSTQQVLTNLGSVKNEVDTGEQSLQSAVGLFEQAQTLAAQGASSTQTADARNNLATQVDTILQQLTSLANTNVNGRYIFAGDADQTAPYRYTAGQANPISAYQGSAATTQAQSPDGSTFATSLTAQQIFDSADPTTSVFQNLQTLSTALKANNTAAIQTAVNSMSKVDSYLNSQLAVYGITQNRVANATNYGQDLVTQLQTQISGYHDADLTAAILQQTQSQTQLQAALQSEAKIPHTSLFDFLG